MNIVTFENHHIEEARAIAFANYQQEQQYVSDLPEIEIMPELSWFAENGLGVAALEDGELVGFLCCVGPFGNAFGSRVKGTFSPIHAHGALTEDRELIYRKMYQAAAEKWVSAGILYHAIALYAHDAQAIGALFRYGFGLRCVDAIRPMSRIHCPPATGYTFRALPKEEIAAIRQLRMQLSAHLGESPCFMYSEPRAEEAWLAKAETRDTQVFVAERNGAAVAFVEVGEDGENFITETPGMKNICGAFCLPQYRGTGLFANLLNFTAAQLRMQGVTWLGVDYESINPTASGARSKYFIPYTHSLVRRIDECALARCKQKEAAV